MNHPIHARLVELRMKRWSLWAKTRAVGRGIWAITKGWLFLTVLYLGALVWFLFEEVKAIFEDWRDETH